MELLLHVLLSNKLHNVIALVLTMALTALKFDVTFLNLVENAINMLNVDGVVTLIAVFTMELVLTNTQDLVPIVPRHVLIMEELVL